MGRNRRIRPLTPTATPQTVRRSFESAGLLRRADPVVSTFGRLEIPLRGALMRAGERLSNILFRIQIDVNVGHVAAATGRGYIPLLPIDRVKRLSTDSK
jgi:hypothetical protein